MHNLTQPLQTLWKGIESPQRSDFLSLRKVEISRGKAKEKWKVEKNAKSACDCVSPHTRTTTSCTTQSTPLSPSVSATHHSPDRDHSIPSVTARHPPTHTHAHTHTQQAVAVPAQTGPSASLARAAQFAFQQLRSTTGTPPPPNPRPPHTHTQ